MMWMLLNAPLMVVFFGAMCGIPLAMVLRNPGWGSAQAGTRRARIAKPQVPGLALAGVQA